MQRLLISALLLWLLSCTGTVPKAEHQPAISESEPSSPGPEVPVSAAHSTPGTGSESVLPAAPEQSGRPADDSGQLVLQFSPKGLTPTYASYAANEELLERLAEGLSKVLSGGAVAVEVSWNDRDKSGAITLYVPEVDTRAELLLPDLRDGKAVPVQQLSPLLAPLGAYREALAGRFDLRFLAFSIQLSFWNRSTGTHCGISGALNDPQGGELGPCFECLDPRRGRLRLCREGTSWPAPIEADDNAIRLLTNALRSQPL